MKVKLRSLSIRAFRSFRGAVTFKLPKGGGLYWMTGKNEVEPQLGAGACGKSSIWDALSWLIYGKSSRGLKAGVVANWDRDEVTRVEGELSVGSRSYSIARTWSPNSLTLAEDGGDPRVVTDEEIERLVGMSHTVFLQAVLMSQFGAWFFDLGAAVKLQVFSDALGLGVWLDVADRVRKQSHVTEQSLIDGEKELAALRATIATLKGQREELAEQSRKFLTGRDEEIAAVRKRLKVERKASEELAARVNKLHKIRRSTSSSIEDLEQALIKADDELKSATSSIAAINERARDTARRLDEAKAKLKAYLASKGACPTCGGKMKPKDHTDAIAVLRGTIVQRHSDEKAIAGELAKEHDNVRRAEKVKSKVNDELTAGEERNRDARDKLDELTPKAQRASNAVTDLQTKIDYLEKNSDPYSKQLETLRVSIASNRDERDALKDEQKTLRSQLGEQQYWVGMFKELRLWLISEALQQLAVEVNNSLLELGLDGWKVTFDVEKETKSGSVSKGFTVLIAPPGHDPVPWEAYCGNETQRLRIAGAVGLSELVRNVRGIDFGFEVWDEPTAHLTAEGVDDLLSFLEGRARVTGRQVWLVDHRSLPRGGFDGTVTITKTSDGSAVESDFRA